jgi:hypothetical protein
MLSFKKFLQEHLLSETEFTGLNNRKKGDPFITDGTPTSGDPLEFVEVKFFPSIDKYPGNIKQVTIVNKTNASLPAFAVATFLNKTTKKEIKYGRFLKVGSKIWENNNPGFFKFQSAASLKYQSGLMAKDILTKFDNLTPQSLLEQVEAKYGESVPVLVDIMKDTIKSGYPNNPNGYDIPEKLLKGVIIYYAELLHPISLIGKPIGLDPSGNAVEGIQKITGKKFIPTSSKIEFSTSASEGSYDSRIVLPGGKIVYISSKESDSSTGGKASSGNLWKMYNEFEDKSIFAPYSKEIFYLQIIQENKAPEGALLLAKTLKIINSEEYNIMMKMDRNIVDDEAVAKKLLTARLQEYRNLKGVKEETLSKEGKVKLFYRVLRSIASLAVDNVNKKTKFSEFACMLVNSSTVQLYTRYTKTGNNIKFKPWKNVWPSTAAVEILLSAEKYKVHTSDKIAYEIKLRKSTSAK